MACSDSIGCRIVVWYNKAVMAYESLHNHTNISDGAQSHLEVLDTAERHGFGVVAFTDHDILPGEKELNALKAYRGPVKWFIGCEITSGLPKELGGGPTSMFHILGLFTDPFNEKLKEHSKQALQARAERMERIVSNLHGLGFAVTAADCLEASGGESVGRPHIVQALLKRDANIALIEGLRADMERASRTDAALKEKYDAMMAQASQKGSSAYPYAIFLSDDSFIPGIYVDYLYSIDMDKSVRLIRGAGGAAILAHWGTVKRKINIAMLEGFLEEKRLDGVETASGFITGDDSETQLQQAAERTGALQTIGIDAHRPEDFEHFVNERNIAERTKGMAGRVIERINPSLEWSNFS